MYSPWGCRIGERLTRYRRGAIGAVGLYLAELWIGARLGADFPCSIFIVSGSFLIGVVSVLVGGVLPG